MNPFTHTIPHPKNTIIILTSDHGEYIPVLNTANGLINLESSSTEKNLWKIGNKIPKNLLPIKKKIALTIRSSRKKLKSSKINSENLSVYEKRVLFDSRMFTGHRMYDDLLRIPLILSGPEIPQNKIITNMVRQVDILPTILSLLSISPPPDIDGQNLLPMMNKKYDEELISYIESPPSVENESMKYIGIRTSKYKFIQNIKGKKFYELYDLEKDPLEEKNIFDENANQVKIAEKLLDEIRNKKPLQKNIEFEKNEKQKIDDVLKKLGYT